MSNDIALLEKPSVVFKGMVDWFLFIFLFDGSTDLPT